MTTSRGWGYPRRFCRLLVLRLGPRRVSARDGHDQSVLLDRTPLVIRVQSAKLFRLFASGNLDCIDWASLDQHHVACANAFFANEGAPVPARLKECDKAPILELRWATLLPGDWLLCVGAILVMPFGGGPSDWCIMVVTVSECAFIADIRGIKAASSTTRSSSGSSLDSLSSSSRSGSWSTRWSLGLRTPARSRTVVVRSGSCGVRQRPRASWRHPVWTRGSRPPRQTSHGTRTTLVKLVNRSGLRPRRTRSNLSG